MTTAVAEDRLAALEAKLDAVSHQLDFVAAALREQELRRGMWDELRRDLAPMTAEAMNRLSRELDDVRAFVEPSSLLRMLKRVLRDLPYLEALLDQVESLSQLGADLSPLGREVLTAAMRGLDDLEQRGYFAFLRGAKPLLDQVVASFGPEELRALEESIPAASEALRHLAHPEVLGLAQHLASALQQAPADDKSLFSLLWQVRRPQARRGLARVLSLLEALGARPGQEPAEYRPTYSEPR